MFPVRIDPDVFYGDERDCTIRSGASAKTSLCGQPLSVGSTSEYVSRALVHVETPTIPGDSEILTTSLGMWFHHDSSTTTAMPVQAYGLTRDFTSSATWETYDGTHAWTKAGGDYTGQALPGGGEQPYSSRFLENYDVGNWVGVGMTALAEKWLQEPSSNHGALIKAENESNGISYEFNEKGNSEGKAPFLEVVYSSRWGTPGNETFNKQQISDRGTLAVNVANGNMLMQNDILDLPGVGYNFPLVATYNNFAFLERHELGAAESLSSGADVEMQHIWWDESRVLHDGSGAWWVFAREPSKDSEGNHAYLSPPGLNATLIEHSGGSDVLTYNESQIKYEFSEAGKLQKIVDANGNTTTFTYNTEGRVSTVTNSGGHKLTYKYKSTEKADLAEITDELSRAWKFTYNTTNQLTAVIDPDGHEYKFAYNTEAENLTQITDPDKHLIELSYDSWSRLTEIRHVVNGTATKAGTKDVITTYSYAIPASKESGCPAESYGDTVVTSPNGSPNGEANSHSSGHQTTYCVNYADAVIKTIDQAGNSSVASYEPATGQLTQYQNPGDTAGGLNVNNTITYNSNRAIEKIVSGTGEGTSLTTNFKYPGNGPDGEFEPESIETPYSSSSQSGTQHTTFFGYDEHGNLETEHEGGPTGSPSLSMEHNAKGQLTASLDGDKNTTKYEYNTANELSKIIPASTAIGDTELSYDTDGRVHSVKDGRGITATYSYDGEDRTTKVEYSDGSSVSFEYDADGNVLNRTDAKGFGEPYTGVTTYEYDKLNRPISELTPSGKTSAYEYDYDSNLTALKDGGGTVSYTYGSDDVLKTIVEPENTSHPYTYTYQSGDDERQSLTYPNGLLACYENDAAGRPTGLREFKPSGGQTCASSISPSATFEDYTLSYKAGTRETAQLQTLNDLKAETKTAYSYDALNRLLRALTTPSGSETATLTSEYEYDGAGNALLNHTYSPSTTYTDEHMLYNAVNEVCAIDVVKPSKCAEPTEEGIAKDPTYDKDGDMTSDGSNGPAKFGYTERDQLASVTPHGMSAVAIVSHGTGQDDLAAIGGEEIVQNVLGVGVTGSGESAHYYTRGSEGTLLAKRSAKGKPNETEYYVLDNNGSPHMLTTATGVQSAPTAGSYGYDPYGKAIGAYPSTFGYRAGLISPNELLHFGARYYDPTIGAWTQQDPLNQTASLTQGNRYVYGADNPTDTTDPTGEVSKATLCVVAAIFCGGTNSGDDIISYPTRAGEALEAYVEVANEYLEPGAEDLGEGIEDFGEDLLDDE